MKVYQIHDKRVKQVNTIEENSKENKYWVLLNREEIGEIEKYLEVGKQTLKECKEDLDIPKLDVYDHYNFGLLHLMGKTKRSKEIKKIHFYHSEQYLFFVLQEPMEIIKEIEEGIRENPKESYSLEKILYILLDKLTHKDFLLLEEMESKIENAEEILMKGSNKDYTKDIIHLRKELLYLRKHYEPLCDMVEELEQNSNEVLNEQSLPYFRIISKRVSRLEQRVTTLRDYVTQVREAYEAQIDISLNKVMKIFTVITALFLPLTLIVGWYGMNFPNMPEFGWKYGYPYVIALSIGVVILCIFIFKKRKWF